MKRGKFLIHFIGIGAEKSGTSWLADCFREHPEIFVPKTKELFFFNEYDAHFLKVPSLRYSWGIDWYQKQFTPSKQEALLGEFTPTYMYDSKAIKRIKKHFPNAKIIISLRNPTKRAFSQYLHDIKLGLVDEEPFEKLLAKNPSYIKKSSYYKHLKPVFEMFPEKNILVIFFDDLKRNPKKTIKKAYKFAGVKNDAFKPEALNKKSNVATTARFRPLNKLLIQTEYFLRKHNLPFVLRLIEDLRLRELAAKISIMNRREIKDYPRIDKKTEKYLKKMLNKDISNLEKFLGVKLDNWK